MNITRITSNLFDSTKIPGIQFKLKTKQPLLGSRTRQDG
ncbi:hypothetical protein [Klebsiella pneumoniae IS46]|nr:hypothetical protein [Klebsiella pneumoniae IS46]